MPIIDVEVVSDGYAENDSPVTAEALPVFGTVLLASPPEDAALQAQVLAVTQCVAASHGKSSDRVHVAYARPGSGRKAFGGQLV